MIQEQTWCNVADNTGATLVKCIKVYGGSRCKYAGLGDLIVVAVKKTTTNPSNKVKSGEVCIARVVRTRAKLRRPDGSVVRFDDNAVVIVDKNSEPRGTAVFGPVARELRDQKLLKIVSLAEEVV